MRGVTHSITKLVSPSRRLAELIIKRTGGCEHNDLAQRLYGVEGMINILAQSENETAAEIRSLHGEQTHPLDISHKYDSDDQKLAREVATEILGMLGIDKSCKLYNLTLNRVSRRVESEIIGTVRFNEARARQEDARQAHFARVSSAKSNFESAPAKVQEILSSDSENIDELADQLVKAEAVVRILEARVHRLRST
jgi:hypothetical protein